MSRRDSPEAERCLHSNNKASNQPHVTAASSGHGKFFVRVVTSESTPTHYGSGTTQEYLPFFFHFTQILPSIPTLLASRSLSYVFRVKAK